MDSTNNSKVRFEEIDKKVTTDVTFLPMEESCFRDRQRVITMRRPKRAGPIIPSIKCPIKKYAIPIKDQ